MARSGPILWPVPEAAVTVFSTPDDGCCGHPKHVEWLCSKINQTAYCCILLTYSMVQSHSWEANWFAASQEIPRISRNPKVHYRTQKRPPPVTILGQPNPVHIPTSHFLDIYPNIIHPSKPRSPQWSPSLRFPQQDPIHPLSSPIRATCPAHLILLDFITRTILGEEYKSFSSSLIVASSWIFINIELWCAEPWA